VLEMFSVISLTTINLDSWKEEVSLIHCYYLESYSIL